MAVCPLCDDLPSVYPVINQKANNHGHRRVIVGLRDIDYVDESDIVVESE